MCGGQPITASNHNFWQRAAQKQGVDNSQKLMPACKTIDYMPDESILSVNPPEAGLILITGVLEWLTTC